MIFEICASIATLVFIVLAIYIIQVLRDLRCSLRRINEVTAKLETKIDPISLETIRLLHNSNNISETVYDQLDSINPLFHSISNVGNAIEEVTSSLNGSCFTKHHKQDEKKKSWEEIVVHVIELAAVGINLVQEIKKKRR